MKNEFTGHSKEDIIMRTVLSFDGVFTSNNVTDKLVSDGRACFSTGTVSRYLKKYEGKYIEVIGKTKGKANNVKLYKLIRDESIRESDEQVHGDVQV